jgi:hypothetical protein
MYTQLIQSRGRRIGCWRQFSSAVLPSTGSGIPPWFNERKSLITSKRPHLLRKPVRTANTKSRSPNRLVTSLLFCDAPIDRKWNSTMIQRTKIINNTETNAYIVETFTECLFSAAILESNGNVRLQVKVANSVHWKYCGKPQILLLKSWTTPIKPQISKVRIEKSNIEIRLFIINPQKNLRKLITFAGLVRLPLWPYQVFPIGKRWNV